MRPDVWCPPEEPTLAEQAVIKAVRRAKLFVFLRRRRGLARHERQADRRARTQGCRGSGPHHRGQSFVADTWRGRCRDPVLIPYGADVAAYR
jgi:hypothetical protein